MVQETCTSVMLYCASFSYTSFLHRVERNSFPHKFVQELLSKFAARNLRHSVVVMALA